MWTRTANHREEDFIGKTMTLDQWKELDPNFTPITKSELVEDYVREFDRSYDQGGPKPPFSVEGLKSDPQMKEEFSDWSNGVFGGSFEKLLSSLISYKYVLEVESDLSTWALVLFSNDDQNWTYTGVTAVW